MTAEERDAWLMLDDKALLRGCRIERRSAGGPGGQKRNKTASTVRFTHEATGLTANAAEDRSLRVNMVHATRRLRHKIAGVTRRELDLMDLSTPTWWGEYVGRGVLRMNVANPMHPQATAFVLDVLDASAADPTVAALHLSISVRSLVRFLHEPSETWRAANDLRTKWSLPALKVP